MKIFIKLLVLNFKVNFGLAALKEYFVRGRRSGVKAVMQLLLILFAVVAGGGSFIGFYSFLAWNIFKAGDAIGQPEVVLSLAFLICLMMTLFFGIFYIMSAFYFSNDIQLLVPLPLKPYQVLGSKFIIVMIFEYFMVLPVVLPPLIIYGIGTGIGTGLGTLAGGLPAALSSAGNLAAGTAEAATAAAVTGAGIAAAVIYWLKSLILILVLPVLPLVIASVFVVFIMRFANLRRHKDLIAILSSFMIIFLSLGFNAMFARMTPGNEQDFFVNLLQNRIGLVEWMGKRFPPSTWATLGVADGGLAGLGYMLLYVGISALLFAVLMAIGNAVFYKSVLAGQEANRKRKTVNFGSAAAVRGASGTASSGALGSISAGTSGIVSSGASGTVYGGDPDTGHGGADGKAAVVKVKGIKVSTPAVAICRREWKLLTRTPIFLINGMSGALIGPIMIFMMMLTQGDSGEMQMLFNIINDPKMSAQAGFIGLGFIIFSSGMNLVGSTSVSREGSTFWISKMIPVSPVEQAAGKLRQSVQVCMVTIAATSAILLFYLKFSPLRVAGIVVISALASLFLQAAGLMIDMARPKLIWTNPQEAIKQNMNGFLGMLAAFALIGVMAAIAVWMLNANVPEWAIYAVLGALCAVLSIVALKMLFASAGKYFNRIEA